MNGAGVFYTGALAVVLVAAVTPSARAACGSGAGGLYSGYSPIHSNPDWPAGASYCKGCGPALSGSHIGVFWHLGKGDPSLGVGEDSGSWSAVYWARRAFKPDGDYHFRGVLAAGGWGGDIGVDHCILTSDPEGCTCVALVDEYPGTSDVQFLAMGARMDPNLAQFNFQQPEKAPLTLVPVPRPSIVRSKSFDDGSVDVTLRVDRPKGGVYKGYEGCDCGPIGYRIRAIQNPRGIATSRNPGTRLKSQWPVLQLGDGRGSNAGVQPVTPFGSEVTVHAACSGGEPVDVYLTAELILPNGTGPAFALDLVSADSPKVECGQR